MSEPIAPLTYREPYYVPTVNMDDNSINTAVALGHIYLRPGQWCIRHGGKVRYLYTRKGGVHAFNHSKGDTIIARSGRMSAALKHYRTAANELTQAEHQRIVNAKLSDLSLWGRIKLIAMGA